MAESEIKPMVTRISLGSMQVCVPIGWSDEQIVEYVNRESPSGMKSGWTVRYVRDRTPFRVPCKERPGCVHVVLDC